MKVRIVLASQNAGWVIGKMAERLCAELRALGVESDIDERPDVSSDVNHWMSYAFAEGCAGTLNTMFITHIDDPFKVRLVKEQLRGDIQFALCMSQYTVSELAAHGVDRARLHHVLPALDDPPQPRRIVIGITTRLYDDGRKRERFLLDIARTMELSDFSFRIFGEGWGGVVPVLRSSGAEVEYDPGSEDWRGDYQRIRSATPEFDYYLYMGMDEGSLGSLDASAAGVKTIVTAQGFHLQMPGGVDHPFTEQGELLHIFQRLATERRRVQGRLRDWTWSRYASEHLQIWRLVLVSSPDLPQEDALNQITARSGQEILPPIPGRSQRRELSFYLKMLSPARLRGAIGRSHLMRPIRRKLGL